jgi:acetolactate synthase I/II/III large subunit
MRTVADELIQSLRDIGVKHIFGVPSGGWVDYMEAIRKTDGIDFVLASHEGGASFMADVCGRITGLPGVCFGTFGPGATNLSTGVGSALLDRSPMIALTDEMPAALRGRTVQMEINHQDLFRPITKKTIRLDSDCVRNTVFNAASLALSTRRGPVHIGLPTNMSAELVAECVSDCPSAALSYPPDSLLLAAAVSQLSKSSRPVVAVGLNAVNAGIQAEIIELAERLRAPVVITPMAKGMIPESHPCYAGVLFHALSDQVGEIHGQADLVLAIGYDPVEFNYESWIPDVPLIHIDSVAADVDDSVTVTCDIVGDISHAVSFLLRSKLSAKNWDFDALAIHRTRLFDRLQSINGDALGPRATLEVLRDVLPDDGIMTCDVGAHTHLIGQKWQTPAPGRQIMTNGWSAMGFGIPSAIAAKLCCPDVSVCTVVGDGGFLMTCGEIATAVREKLNIVILILTDNDLALIRIKQQRKDNPIYGTPVRNQGTIGGDNIFGAPVLQARDSDELRAALNEGFNKDGPTIVEAICNSREYDDLVLRKDRQ